MRFFYKSSPPKIIKNMIVAALLLSMIPTHAFALSKKSVETVHQARNEKDYLIQIYNALTAIQPLILNAKLNQSPNISVKFHYTKFVDNQGRVHNGLLEDVQAMREGIVAGLEPISIAPRVINPVSGDYINNFKDKRLVSEKVKTGKPEKHE